MNLRFLPALVVLGMLLMACGDAEPAATSASPNSTEPATTEVAQSGSAIDLQGHRGARGLKPENTLPSFEAALDLGVTTLELDLHFSADGEVIVWHDPVVSGDKCRLGEDQEIPDPANPLTPDADLAVKNLTAAQLRSYVCDQNPDQRRFPDQNTEPTAIAGSDFGILTLTELFAFVDMYATTGVKTGEQRAAAETVALNIETKRVAADPSTIGDGFDGSEAGPFELAVLDAIDAWGSPERVTVQSFDHRSLWAVAAVRTDIALAALTTDPGVDYADLVSKGAKIWSPRASSLNAGAVADAQTAGLTVIPWTVNDPGDMADLVELGVDGIITDRPDLFPG